MTRSVAAVLTITVFLTIATTIGQLSAPWPAVGPEFGTVEALGMSIYQQALVPFELISITLLVAIIGAVAVARGRTAEEAALSATPRPAGDGEAAE